MVSGLASSIRSATESATFDLAGHDAASIRSVVADAFGSSSSSSSSSSADAGGPSPLAFHFDLPAMIRITFVVGGGKSSRSRYDEKAMQAVTGTLRQACGYVEDRGASCVMECGGCYKTQHDTGRNVFTVVVFPMVAGGGGRNDDGGGGGDGEGDDEPLIPENSPGYKMAVSSQKTFRNLLFTYCPTYLEKRECLHCLEGLIQVEQAMEAKMTAGHPLDSGEKSFYDVSSDLKEKYAFVQGEMARQVEEGRITPNERKVLLESNEKRIEGLMNERSTASVAEKLKKALARKRQLESLGDDKLSPPPPLRHENRIAALRKKLVPLMELEGIARGRLLTLAETRSLAEKDEMEDEISRMEEASCGWFEEEGAFNERVRKSRERFEAKSSRSKRSGGKANSAAVSGRGGGNSAVNKWILPGEKPKPTWGGGGIGGKKMRPKGGAVFTAMMMDSSSDEEEEDDESGAEESDREDVLEVKSYAKIRRKDLPVTSNALFSKKSAAPSAAKGVNIVKPASTAKGENNPISATESTGNDAGEQARTKSGKKNKKKKKKGKSKKSASAAEDEILEVDEAAEPDETTPPASIEVAPSSVSESLLQFVRSILLPLLMGILGLIVSLVTSMFARKEPKRVGKMKRG